MSSAAVGRKPRVLAISSGGGHWVQLLRLRPAFEGCDMTFATVKDVYRDEVGPARFRTVCDADLSSKARLARSAVSVLWTVVRHQPDVVISTGSAPGYFALAFGKLLGARTIWVDSMANADALSVSGQRAGRFADLWLTQWPDLAREGGPHYRGSVL